MGSVSMPKSQKKWDMKMESDESKKKGKPKGRKAPQRYGDVLKSTTAANRRQAKKPKNPFEVIAEALMAPLPPDMKDGLRRAAAGVGRTVSGLMPKPQPAEAPAPATGRKK